MLIADLRAELGLSLEEFASRIGLASRGRMSVIERENRCSLDVALRIEDLAQGRIDAASLNADVRAARHGLDHDAVQQGASTGQTEPLSTGGAA